MVVGQAEVWWADLADPVGSVAGYRRPVVVVQCDALNRSKLATTLCVPLTSNLKWADAPGNVALSGKATGLSKDSVACCALSFAVDKQQLLERVGKLSRAQFARVLAALDLVLGR